MGFENLSAKEPPKEQENATETSEKRIRLFCYVVAGVLSTLAAIEGTGQSPREISLEEFLDWKRMKIEFLQKDALDLGELTKDFEAGIQVESGSGKYIIHIAQIHSPSGVPKIRALTEGITRYQESLAPLILKLKEKYGITTFFNEGDTLYEGDPILLSANATPKYVLTTPEEFDTKGKDVLDSYERNKNTSEVPGVKEWKYRTKLTATNMHIHYSRLSHPEARQVADKAKLIVDDIDRQYPELAREMFYKDGAAHWLAEQGLINLLPAETSGGNSRAVDESLSPSEQREAVTTGRENVAVSLGLQHTFNTNDKYIPIIYGGGHDFSSAVTKLNEMQTNPEDKVGLIRIHKKNLD